jgi:hypothetical protein
MPIAYDTANPKGAFLRYNERKNSATPIETANMEIKITNLPSSFFKGEVGGAPPVVSSAILPIMVLSPILNTIPLPFPSLQRVPKNATFFVSVIFSMFVHSATRG